MREIQFPLKTKGWTLIQVLCVVLTATTRGKVTPLKHGQKHREEEGNSAQGREG